MSNTTAVPQEMSGPDATLEATQGQMDGFFSQLPYKPPRRGGICERLTQDLPSSRLKGGKGNSRGRSEHLARYTLTGNAWTFTAEGPLGPLGFEGAQHRQTLRPSVDGVRSKALRPFGSQ